MAQLSLPYRIALIAMLAVCALWFTLLKPQDPVAEPDPTAPGMTGLANGVTAAKGAASASEASAARSQAATGATDSATAAAPATAATEANAAKPAKASAPKADPERKLAAGDRSGPLLRALDRDRAVVLLVWNKRGIDDRAVRDAVAAADRRNGRVVVKAVPVADIGRYEAITRGAQVLESPTVLVIGPGKKAKPIVGFTTTAELDQAVGDALAAK